jgi:hypothetical protein
MQKTEYEINRETILSYNSQNQVCETVGVGVDETVIVGVWLTLLVSVASGLLDGWAAV